MIWFLIGLVTGSAAGIILAGMLASGAIEDAYRRGWVEALRKLRESAERRTG